jgi:catechol 2,3-dioxygenase-like lactoylglutathione lyase family enzyme
MELLANAAAGQPEFTLWRVAIPCADLDAAVEFYCGRLGFTLVGFDEYPTRKQAFVALQAGGAALELYQPKPATLQSLRSRPDHLAFDCGDLDACRQRLLAAGVHSVPAPVDLGGGVRQFSIIDPEGLMLEFYEGRAVYEKAIGAQLLAAS